MHQHDFKLLTAMVLLAACVLANPAFASVTTTLTPGDINGGDTNTAMFDDGLLQLTPFIGGAAATFNADASRLGIDNNGTNNNAFNDVDTDPNNNNDERLGFSFASTVGLSQIGWDFARADGVDGGVSISGFIADPMATFSGQATGYTSTYDSGTGTLFFEVPVSAFTNDDGFLNLGNLSASAGQSLLLRVADLDEAGAQLPITTISYTTLKPVPEPAAAIILFPLSVLVASRRRRVE